MIYLGKKVKTKKGGGGAYISLPHHSRTDPGRREYATGVVAKS
jgi:hypothetical protein